LSDARTALEGSGLLPYQITHTISLFSNINAGLLAAEGTDLTTLLTAPPRPVRDLVTAAVRAGGYHSRPVAVTS